MKTQMIKYIIVCMVLSLVTIAASAQEITGYAVMKMNKDMLNSNHEQVLFTMKLTNKKGNTRTRELIQYTQTNTEDNRSILLRFITPADVAGIGFLSIENQNREDDQWLYMPALGRSRRISASDETDNFIGSDFTYEDIGTEEIDEYAYQLLSQEKVNDKDCYKVEAKPLNAQKQKESGYIKRIIYVDKISHLVVKTDYYNKNNELCKTYLAEAIIQEEKTNKWRACTMIMKDLKTNHSTTLEFGTYHINEGIQDMLFTQRSLEAGS